MTEIEKRQQFITDLREFADLLENKPELPAPYSQLCMSGFLDDELKPEAQRKRLGELARAFAPVEKTFGTWHIGVKLIENENLVYTVYAKREAVCKAVTKVTIVPERVIPAQLAIDEVVIPAHEETVTEWECSSLLAEEVKK